MFGLYLIIITKLDVIYTPYIICNRDIPDIKLVRYLALVLVRMSGQSWALNSITGQIPDIWPNIMA